MRFAVIAVSVGVIVGLLALIILGIIVTPAITTCGTINTPNQFYWLGQNLEGAPETGVPYDGGYFNGVCIVINASNVVLDCNGYNITDNGTAPMTVGIIAMGGHSNITIMNCPSVSNYTYGVGLDTVDYSKVINVTAHHNAEGGIYIARYGDHNTIENCTTHHNGIDIPYSGINARDGFYMFSGTDNTFIDNIAYDNYYGFEIRSGASTTNMTNNTAYQNNHGFRLASSSNNDLDDNTAYDNSRGFYIWQGSTNTFTNNDVYDNSYGFYTGATSYNTFADNDVYENDYNGFHVILSPNNTFTSNTVYENSDNGFYLAESDDNTLTDNTGYDNDYGFYLTESDGNVLTSNTAYENTYDGFHLSLSDDNNLTSNDAYENDEHGFHLVTSSSNDLFENDAYQNGIHGIFVKLNSHYNNLVDNLAYQNGIYGFSIFLGSENNTLQENQAHDNERGFNIASASYNNLTDNNAHSNVASGFLMSNASGCMLTDNIAQNNDAAGFELNSGSDFNTLTTNEAYENEFGFFLNSSSNNNLTENTARLNSAGFILYNSSSDNNLIDNEGCGNAIGFLAVEVPYNLLMNNTACNNTLSEGFFDMGFVISNSSDVVMADNAIYGNEKGTYLEESSANMTNDHYYNNDNYDMWVTGTGGKTVNLFGVVFDNPAGDLTNYTNLSMHDMVSSEYRIEWDDEPAFGMPTLAHRSFEGKFLYLRNYTPTSIESMTWHWTQEEVDGGLYGPYAENGLQLWKAGLEGGWSQLPAARNILENTLTLTDLDDFSTFAILAGPPPEDDDGGEPEPDPLSVGFESTCDGNVVTVTSGGSPVKDAKVVVKDTTLLEVYYTDGNGQVVFPGCSMTVDIEVSKSGYDSYSAKKSLIDCCLPPECTTDEDCPDDQYCADGECVPVECPCGEVRNHQCFAYECCADEDCPEGQVCIDNECQAERPVCESDADCEGTEYCDTATGNCGPVTGVCGYATAHTWVQYQCGDEPGCEPCPLGSMCVEHRCVSGGLEGPDEGFVGESVSLTAKENDEKCADCLVEITDPTGKKLTGRTDANGNLELPLNIEGEYRITLISGGERLATKAVAALTRPPLPEEKPLTTILAEFVSQFWLVLLILLALLLLYWRTRGKKKKRKR